MERFLLFAAADGRVGVDGGWLDFRGAFATCEEAQAHFDASVEAGRCQSPCDHCRQEDASWAHVVHAGEIVSTFRYGTDPWEGIGPKWFPVNR